MKVILAFLLVALISNVTSLACGTNPLLRAFDIVAPSQTPKIAEGIKFCKSLQGKDSCCSAETINGFQDRSDALIKRLTSAVAKRDVALIDIRKNTLPSLDGKLRAMKQASMNAIIALGQSMGNNAGVGGTSGEGGLEDVFGNIMILAIIQGYGQMATILTDSLGTLQSNFTDYQAHRAACVVNIVKIQAAAWCLACEPNWAEQGLDVKGALTFSTELTQTLTDSCYNYFAGAASQSMIFGINMISSSLSAMTSAMNKVARNDPKGSVELMTAMASSAISGSIDSSKIPIDFPEDCDRDACSWIAQSLFENGKLHEDSLTMGGSLDSDDSSNSGSGTGSDTGSGSGTGTDNGKRMLVQDGWNPDPDEAGVTVTFEKNPGNVNNSASLYKSIMGGLLVLLAVILI